MNKTFRHVLSLALMLALIFSFSVTAFAEDESIFDGTLTYTANQFSPDQDGVTWVKNNTKKAGTLTLTNSDDITRTLSFEASDAVTITKDNESVSGNSVILAPGEKIVFSVAKPKTGTVTLISFSFIANTTFEPAVNGSYTVDGEEVTESRQFSDITNGKSYNSHSVSATPAEGYQFAGWYTGETLISAEPNTDLAADAENKVITARFEKTVSEGDAVFSVGGTLFEDYASALAFAQNGNMDTIVLVKDYTLTEDITVPGGITLLIPFNDEHTCFTGDIQLENDPRTNQVYNPSSPYKTLTLAEGVTITVNGGLSVSAQYTAPGGSNSSFGVTGPYGFVTMERGSSIVVDGGALYAWGYISGSGSVNVQSGRVYEYMQIGDFGGGSAALAAAGKGVFPFSQYYVQNVEVPMTLSSAATETVVAPLYALSRPFCAEIPFIGNGGMFSVSGSVTKSYWAGNDSLHLSIYGNGSINSIEMSLMGYDISSSDFILPITNNISINVASGNTTLSQDMSLLAGAEVNIEEGASISVTEGNSVYVYDSEEWNSGNFAGGAHIRPVKRISSGAPAGRDSSRNAKVDVNGTVEVHGYLYTTESGADIISSGKTGEILYFAPAGTAETITQVEISGTNANDKAIPVNAAWLKNGDGSFTETKDAQENERYYYDAEQDKWVGPFSVSFDANAPEGAAVTGEMLPMRVNPGEAVTLDENAFVCSGYEFLGWATGADGEVEYADKATIEAVTEDITLYAQWEKQGFTISFNPNAPEGEYTGTMEPINLVADLDEDGAIVDFVLPDCSFVRPGYRFTGWTFAEELEELAADPSYDAFAYSAGDPYTGDLDDEFVDTTLYALWEPAETVSVSFEVNLPVSGSASGGMEDQQVVADAPTELNGNTVVVDGYRFDGWNTAADGSGDAYKDKAEITVSEDTTLYAQWVKVWTITWKSGDEVLKTETVDEGTVPVFDGEEPAKAEDEGYTYSFTGWDPEPVEAAEDAEYSAVFTAAPKTYHVTFNPNYEGDAVNKDQPMSYGTETALEANTFDRTGYTFTAWNTAADGSGTAYANGAPITITGNVTLYAQWEIKSYTITWKNWDGTVLKEDTVNYDVVPEYTGATPTRPDTAYSTYTFTGWDPEPTAAVENAEYTAQYSESERSFTVTFDPNGGFFQDAYAAYGNHVAVIEGFEGGKSIPLPNAAKLGSTLKWSDGTNLYDAGYSYTVNGDVTFTAQWSAQTFTVKFLPGAENASGSMEDLTVTFGEALDLPANSYTVPGMVFTGWRDQNGTNYTDQQTGVRVEQHANDNGVLTLTAQWDDAEYEVSFALNGGSFTDETQKNPFYTSYQARITLPDAQKTGYSLQWSDGTAEYAAGSTYTVTQDVDFTAVWTPIVYTIPVDYGYEISDVDFTVEDGVYTKLGTPTWPGHTFTGWWLDQNNEEIPQNANYDPAYFKIIAKWELDAYTVTFALNEGSFTDITQVNPLTEKHYGDKITLPAVQRTGYDFLGWKAGENTYAAGAEFTVTETVTIEAQWQIKTYTVTWNVEGSKTEETYEYGATPEYKGEKPSKASDELYNYSFNGWSPAIGPVNAVVEYAAQFSRTPITHTVSFDGNDADHGEMGALVINGVTTTALPANAYTKDDSDFTGWNTAADGSGTAYADQAPIQSTTDLTLYAQWKIKTYTITWTDDAGNVIGTTTVNHGDIPGHGSVEKEATPEYTYTFAGWTPTPNPATGDATYRATFHAEKRSYTITWKDDAGEVINSTTVEYGDTPTHDEPTKAATPEYTYTFAGWTPEVEAVTGDATYQATFTGEKNSYAVIFKNYDGTELQKTTLEYGTQITYTGEVPTKPETAQYAYTFSGWDPALAADATVTGEATYTAQFSETVREYTIRFVDEDGTTELATATVAYGETPVYEGNLPDKEATAQYTYTFSGWDPEITSVTGDATYKAVYSYTVNEYTVTFKNDDGTVLQSGKVAYGETPAYSGTPTKAATAEYTYTFAGWDRDIVPVNGDAEYVATYTATRNSYTVIFKGEDGSVLDQQTVEYGTVPEYHGEMPIKDATDEFTYAFGGWTPDVVAVTGNATYTVKFTETRNEYTIKFVDDDGTVLQSSEVAYGDIPAAPADPTKAPDAQYTYSFTGWSPAIASVTGEATYTATYSKTVNSYMVTFRNEDGTVLQSSEVAYGETPVYSGDTPVKTGGDAHHSYTWLGWTPTISAVTGDAIYTATFSGTVNSYTITWVDYDGKVLKTDSVEYGQTPAAPADPVRAATESTVYAFAGWTPAVGTVEGDQTYTATYSESARMYTVKWLNGDGSVLDTKQAAYGAPVPAYEGGRPVKAATAEFSYEFTGWTPEVQEGDTVQSDMTFTPVFSETKNSYTVTWSVEGQNDVTETYEYGQLPAFKGDTPTKDSDNEHTYSFKEWSPAITTVTGDATYTAVFEASVRTYTIVWKHEDGTVLKTETLAYNAQPTEPETPTKATSDNETGSYEFTGWMPAVAPVTGKAEYTAQFSFTGWRRDSVGKQYFIASQLQKTGLTEIDGQTYYLDPKDGYAAVSTVVSVEAGDPGHAFDENGVFLGSYSGVFKDVKNDAIYLVSNGIVEVFPGLYKTADSEYYYFGEDNKAVRGEVKWVEKNHADPENEADHGMLPKWDYDFGPDGIIKHESVDLDGVQVVNGVKYYYIDGIRVHYGMFYQDGYYYYADRTGKLVTGKTYWCVDNYGLMEEGPYTFDDQGRMVIAEAKNGIYAEDGSLFYYKDGSRFYAGLVELDGTTKVHAADGSVTDALPGFYYVKTSGELVHGRSYWITKTNGLKPEKAYPFADDGRMDLGKNGIYAEDGSLFYYQEGMRTYAGLIQIDGAYYYVKTNGEVVHGRSYWISKTNDLLPEKAYTFADDGKMVVDVPTDGEGKNGIVAENDSLWYYVDGKLTYAGLIEIDGEYYYVKTSGEVVHGRSYWISKTNGLLPEKSYTFADDGKMIR